MPDHSRETKAIFGGPTFIGKIVIAVGAILSIWAAAALYFDVRISWLQVPCAVLFIVWVIAVLRVSHGSRTGILIWMGSLLAVMVWWFSLRPTHDRDWQPDVAQLPWTETNGNFVTIHNVRNFEYRSETDFTQRWETRTVDVSKIRGVDLFLTHFGSPLIAHAIVSFQFADNSSADTSDSTYIAMSIEQRKAVGQSYSTVRGFFRQYELIYLAADEHDIVRLRTNYRTGEYVRLYRTLTKPDDARRLFMQYLKWIETLRQHPQWYNALTDNCTTSITSFLERQNIGGLSRWDWRNLLNGLGDRMLYDDGDLATGGLSFDDLAKQAFINDQAKRLGDDADFSRDIRRRHIGF
jgi:hypothetical protein